MKSPKVGMKRKQRQRYVINTGFKFLIKRNKVKDIYDNLDFCFLSMFSRLNFELHVLIADCLTISRKYSKIPQWLLIGRTNL